MFRCTTVAAALLLSIGLCQAARDEGADKKGVLQAGGREAGLETIGVSAHHFTRETIAKGAKHSARAHDDGNTTEPEDDEHDDEELSSADGNATEDASGHGSEDADASEHEDEDAAEHGSAERLSDNNDEAADNGTGSSNGEGSEDRSGSKEDEGNSLAQETVAREQRPVLCDVTPGLEPSKALRQIEECVKQLENIKEGTLQQGKQSWHHNNLYVKKLADMENRMTELARPEPFEIAFAVDQADMFDKLKNRLEAITLDLPKLQGKDAGELPGIPKEETEAPKAEDDAQPNEEDAHSEAAHSNESDADGATAAEADSKVDGSKAESDADDDDSQAASKVDEGSDGSEKPDETHKAFPSALAAQGG